MLPIDADASPNFLPRLWQILDLHAVMPFTISITMVPALMTVALEIGSGTPRDQRDLVRDINRVMAVRRAQLIGATAAHPPPPSRPEPEAGPVSKALSHTWRFLGLDQRRSGPAGRLETVGFKNEKGESGRRSGPDGNRCAVGDMNLAERGQ